MIEKAFSTQAFRSGIRVTNSVPAKCKQGQQGPKNKMAQLLKHCWMMSKNRR